jgi:hypothetical protein
MFIVLEIHPNQSIYSYFPKNYQHEALPVSSIALPYSYVRHFICFLEPCNVSYRNVAWQEHNVPSNSLDRPNPGQKRQLQQLLWQSVGFCG